MNALPSLTGQCPATPPWNLQAGMEGVDAEYVKRVVYEASKAGRARLGAGRL